MSAFISKKYSYRGAVNNHGVSAQTVGETLESIRAEGKDGTAEELVNYSRPDDSPTHNLFTWDDSVAAELYRTHEAKNIINAITIETVIHREEDRIVEAEIVTLDEETPNYNVIKSPAFVNVNPKGFGIRGNFVPIEIAMKNNDMRSQVLKNALGELESFTKKYSRFNEFVKVFTAIKEVRKELGYE